MNPEGRHLIIDYWGCDQALLADVARVEAMLRMAADAAGAKVVTATMHAFSPGGVTGFLILEESHLSIHTWPEQGYAAVDFYTCGDCDPGRADGMLYRALDAVRSERHMVMRGNAWRASVPPRISSMRPGNNAGGGENR